MVAATLLARDVGGRAASLTLLILNILFELFMMGWVLCGRRLRQVHVVATLGLLSMCILVGDLQARTMGSETWPALVLVVDMLLVLRVGENVTIGFVSVTVVWLLIVACETTFRFGLFDVPGLSDQEERVEHFASVLRCDSVPCPLEGQRGMSYLLFGAIVFYLDFLATRRFAREVLTEQAAMERTIATVEGVTRLLAKYDVDAVDRMLTQREADLPALMFETLKQMEENLRQYRPYLPAALFVEREDGGRVSRQFLPPPVGQDGEATIVFTDIRLSTSIWECAPEGMRAGLRIHNAVIRDVMQAFNGYEVKTIGDAFMVAFETTLDGMNFALRVHERLRDAAWPASLLEDAPICAEQGSLWGGLTVRIGVNSGAVSVEQSSVTGRGDYFGRTVNVAARLESTCTPGAVAIPAALCSICSTLDAVVGDAQTVYLKGLSSGMVVHDVWPASLARRQRIPLVETAVLRTESSSSSFGETLTLPIHKPLCNDVCATVAMVELDTEETCLLSTALSALTTALDQSGGVLVALLGSCVCVGWNLAKSSPAHVENAIRFVQKLDRTQLVHIGLATGRVQYGNVGARNQRFVTVMGPAVRRAWTLCELASAESRLCLYEPLTGETLSCAVTLQLEKHSLPGVFQTQRENNRDSVRE